MSNANLGAFVSRILGHIMLVTTALLIGCIAQELHSSSTLTIKKWGFRTVYTLGREPLEYWLTVLSHFVTALVLGCLATGAFWLARLESKLTSPIKKQNTRK